MKRSRPGLHEAVLLSLLAGVMLIAWRLDPSFVMKDVQAGLAVHAAELKLAALVMTLIVISGGIDLSIGSIVALSAVTFGMLYEAGVPVWVSSCACLLVGAGAGSLNGVFIARLGLHPLVVTLATMAVFRGVAEGVSVGRAVSGFPAGFHWLGAGKIGPVPAPVLIALVGVLVATVLASRSVMGFRLYAVGDNERAARYAVVPVERLKFMLYTMSGATAGLCALLLMSRHDTAKADMGTGLELEAITAVVLGGTSIHGGRGKIVGTVLGVVLIHEVREFIGWHWAKDELILLVIGGMLIAAVLANNALARLHRRRRT